MHKSASTIKCLSVITILLFAAGFVHAAKDPKINFKKDKWDFGSTKEGKSLNYTFEFTNDGDGTLKIGKVQTSCGCAAALITKKNYKPGEKGQIKVTFNTKGYEGDVSKYVYVESNDPKQPNKMLTIAASIAVPPRPKIELNRYSVDLGLILEGDEIQTETTLLNKGEKELSVVLGHKDAQFFIGGKRVTSAVKIAPKKSVDITVKIPNALRTGMVREYVLMRSNDPMRPNLSLYLSGYVVSKDQLRELFDKYKNILR